MYFLLIHTFSKWNTIWKLTLSQSPSRVHIYQSYAPATADAPDSVWLITLCVLLLLLLRPHNKYVRSPVMYKHELLPVQYAWSKQYRMSSLRKRQQLALYRPISECISAPLSFMRPWNIHTARSVRIWRYSLRSKLCRQWEFCCNVLLIWKLCWHTSRTLRHFIMWHKQQQRTNVMSKCMWHTYNVHRLYIYSQCDRANVLQPMWSQWLVLTAKAVQRLIKLTLFDLKYNFQTSNFDAFSSYFPPSSCLFIYIIS